MRLKFYSYSLPSVTHPEENQDAFFIDRKNNAAGLFDGVGGLSFGKEAAISASEFCRVELTQSGIENTLVLCHEFIKVKSEKELLKDAATTASTIQIYPAQSPAIIIWGNVGDSRIYHLSSGGLKQESTDDSLITQAREREWINEEREAKINQATNLKGFSEVEKNLFDSRHILIQALGLGEMKPRIGKFRAQKRDLVLLTSDGVHDNLTNKQMEEVLKGRSQNPAKELVDKAKKVSEEGSIRAKPDDMTAIIIELF